MSGARLTRFPFLRSFAARIPVLPLTGRPLTKPTTAYAPISHARPSRPTIRLTSRSFSSTSPRRNSDDSQSLSARLKHLIKSYGWHALGVYMILSVLDFTVAFGLINFIGAAHVARITASAKAYVADHLPNVSFPWSQVEGPEDVGRDRIGGGDGSLYAMIVLAYTVHKTLFLPVRVGLTAALTPKLVGVLRERGWAGASGARRAADHYKQKIKDYRDRERGD
ncbi:putative transmembrane protein [Rhizoctonia solani 123E]|uniref:Putative transmembrane protein n=1 Tax=Rhizoctonia solani 123E TaxID=1423351 RepID=A0A074RTE7_9AGAM|nr:putative transmembrane protein [Rhizoctonia solani 123E]